MATPTIWIEYEQRWRVRIPRLFTLARYDIMAGRVRVGRLHVVGFRTLRRYRIRSWKVRG